MSTQHCLHLRQIASLASSSASVRSGGPAGIVARVRPNGQATGAFSAASHSSRNV